MNEPRGGPSPAFPAPDLTDLFRTLKRRRFPVDLRQLLAAQDLVLSLTARGRLPARPAGLKTLLAPIFVGSPEEQARFYVLFDAWLAERGEAKDEKAAEDGPGQGGDDVEGGRGAGVRSDDSASAQRRRRRGWLALLLLLLAIAAPIFAFRGALYEFCEQDLGWCGSRAVQPNPEPVAAPEPGEMPAPARLREAGERFRDPLTYRRYLPPQDDPTLGIRTWALRLTPLLLVLAWWAWRRWRGALWLGKRGLGSVPDLLSLGVRERAGALYRDAEARRGLQRLRLHRDLPSRELDMDATVEALARTGGEFTPRYRSRKALPEYLVLVDRQGADDQRARVLDELVAAMEAEGLHVACYSFYGDPRAVYDPVRGRTDLSGLARLHPEHRLVVLSDGAGLFHPYSGHLEPWGAALAEWPEAALLTPSALAHWGERERLLLRLGLLVLPATAAGVKDLARAMGNKDDWEGVLRGALGAGSRGGTEAASFPDVLQGVPGRWLAPVPPPGFAVTDLLAELRAWLGRDSYGWLAACAVYPELDWRLTLTLGLELAGREDRPPPGEAEFLRLAALPWLRRGSMPDWLRAALLLDQPRERRVLVRALIDGLLDESLAGDGGLGVVRRGSKGPRRGPFAWWSRMRETLSRRLRWRVLREGAAEDSPLRDFVFASFLLGRTPRPIHFRLPARLRRLVEQPELGLLGWRTGLSLVAALGVGALAGKLLGPELEVPPPRLTQTRAEGPEMIVVPAGRIGPKAGDSGKEPSAAAGIRIERPFAIGRTEVSMADYQRFLESEEGRVGREGLGGANGRHTMWEQAERIGSGLTSSFRLVPGEVWELWPAPAISREDAQAYADWLSRRTGARYRLPSEKEWAYAARAGTDTRYWWGDEVRRDSRTWASCIGCGEDPGRAEMVRVDALPANPFGLHNVLGNLAEWTAGCWSPEEAPAAATRRPSSQAACPEGTARGGALSVEPERITVSYREAVSVTAREPAMGLRLVRELPETECVPPTGAGAEFRCPLKDGGESPLMVVIPAGEFDMGSPEKEDGRTSGEGPVHPVRIGRPFALAKREVTVAEFRRFVDATNYRTDAETSGEGCYTLKSAEGTDSGYVKEANWRRPGFEQTGDHPAVCLSWNDAVAYADWLTKETGRPYRLPSEAEWEYAVRAGTTTSRFWGDDPNGACTYANVADRSAEARFPGGAVHDCDDGHVFTAPVGSFKPNPFGLLDIQGNAWEWVQDCWNDGYEGAPADGSAWTDGDCGRRVLRGGGWHDGPAWVRSAYRYWDELDARYYDVGVRLAQDL